MIWRFHGKITRLESSGNSLSGTFWRAETNFDHVFIGTEDFYDKIQR